MALPKDLKSNMTGMPAFDPESTTTESVIPPIDDTEVVPPVEPFTPVAPEAPAIPDKPEEVLKRVEAQLTSIAQMLSSNRHLLLILLV